MPGVFHKNGHVNLIPFDWIDHISRGLVFRNVHASVAKVFMQLSVAGESRGHLEVPQDTTVVSRWDKRRALAMVDG